MYKEKKDYHYYAINKICIHFHLQFVSLTVLSQGPGFFFD